MFLCLFSSFQEIFDFQIAYIPLKSSENRRFLMNSAGMEVNCLKFVINTGSHILLDIRQIF